MSFLQDRLYPASFKGASFIFIGADINAGRKTVAHEYPNKDFRYVEDLGKNLRTFSIRAIIQGFFYETNKKTLEDALNDEGIGILVHPFLGNINCVCTGYTVSEDLTSTGIANYTLNFLEAKTSRFPDASTDNISKIADLYRKLYDFIKDDLNGQYIAQFARNIYFSAQKLRDLTDTLNLIANTTKSLNTSSTEFRAQSNSFHRDAFKIASPNGDIGGNLSDFVSSFDSLSSDGQTRFDASSRLFGFGADDEFIDLPTTQIRQRNSNQKFINGSINALAFANQIDSAKDIDYATEDDLNDTAQILDENYDFLLNSESDNFSNQLLSDINELRNQMRIFFEQKRLVINKIVEITTKPIPATVLTYQYYGNVDDYEQILSLNNIFNPAVVDNGLKILEA